MSAGDVFASQPVTSGTVSMQPAASVSVMITNIMCSTDNADLQTPAGYSMKGAAAADSTNSTTFLAKMGWTITTGGRIFMTNAVYFNLRSFSGTTGFAYSGIEI